MQYADDEQRQSWRKGFREGQPLIAAMDKESPVLEKVI